jgi:VWFA-related protein
MAEKAGTGDNKTKIEALHDAASRFVDLMREKAEATLLPFSSQVEQPGEFTTNKRLLKDRIHGLKPAGGTAIYDATYQGIQTVVASKPKGKRYVVVLTDGVDEDPGSRHSPDEVIQLAREEGVPLYLLGLGSKEEINEEVMKRMAKETGGSYDRVENQEQLYKVFEKLSIEIHGDGIDEEALKSLAEQTGGRYFRASDASELRLKYEEVATALRDTERVTFRSVRQVMDALPSAIDIFIVDKSGATVSNREEADSHRSGLVVARVNYLVYLFLLAGLAGLLLLPSAFRRAAT